jgi:hypothetical protein
LTSAASRVVKAAGGVRTQLSVLGAPSVSLGRTLFVGNNGIVDPTCGDLSRPCRSISQAILNADNGDTILVGAGRYGDINGNGSEDLGDETSGFNTGCMICIDKSLTILSRCGACGNTAVCDQPSAAVTVMPDGKTQKLIETWVRK